MCVCLCFLSTCLDVRLQNVSLSVYVFLCLLHICLYVCVPMGVLGGVSSYKEIEFHVYVIKEGG